MFFVVVVVVVVVVVFSKMMRVRVRDWFVSRHYSTRG